VTSCGPMVIARTLREVEHVTPAPMLGAGVREDPFVVG
jgi:hypothetical protein